MSARVGFIGLGNMGRPMAVESVPQGLSRSLVYDVESRAGRALIRLGARAAHDVAAAMSARAATSSSRCCRTRRVVEQVVAGRERRARSTLAPAASSWT